jgi:hypothetical protein
MARGLDLGRRMPAAKTRDTAVRENIFFLPHRILCVPELAKAAKFHDIDTAEAAMSYDRKALVIFCGGCGDRGCERTQRVGAHSSRADGGF